MITECDHEFDMRMPWAPSSMDGTYVHVVIEATCEKCNMEISSDYSWDVTDGEVTTEGDEEYECDECNADMGAHPTITHDEYDAHFCCRECQAAYKGEEYEDEEE